MSEIKQTVEILDKKKGPDFRPFFRVNTKCSGPKLDGKSELLRALFLLRGRYRVQPMAGSQDA